MLTEALEIIRSLHSGDLTTFDGQYFRVDSARIWDLPSGGVPIGVAVSGDKSCERFAPLGDHLITVQPQADIVERWNAARGTDMAPSRSIGQIPICWDPSKDAAVQRAHEQFRWFGGDWPVNADLPTPAGFEAASQFVRPEDVAASIPCGPDVEAIVDAVSAFWQAGFTDVALVQVGDDGQQRFLDEAARDVLSALREAASS